MLSYGDIVDYHYRIFQELGRGGTSRVYLAKHVTTGEFWAIKEVYKNKLYNNGINPGRLISEVRILRKLRHPGLPEIVDVMETSDAVLIVMQFIEGVTLQKKLTESGAQSEENVIKWGIQICDILDYLHNQNPPIIYRDMKPSNIMVKPDGNVSLIDFGIAREFKDNSNRDTAYLGTKGYAAPEQYGGYGQTDERTDIYCLGATLYHLVTGHNPSEPPYGINPIRTINSSLSEKLERIINKCTQNDPHYRYQNVKELRDDLSLIRQSRGRDVSNDKKDDEISNKGVNSENINEVLDNGRIPVVPVGKKTKSNKSKNSENSNSFLWLFILIPIVLIFIIALVLAIYFGSSYLSDDTSGYVEEYNSVYLGEIGYFYEDVSIEYPDQRHIYEFIPEESTTYNFYTSSGNKIPVIWIYDSNDEIILEANTTGVADEIDENCWLTSGKTYYLETTLYDLNPDVVSTGDYVIYGSPY